LKEILISKVFHNFGSQIIMGNQLDSPKTEKDGETFISSTGLEAGSTGMQGWRLEMEDSHVAIDLPGFPNHQFFAVFDGHAGAGAAKYASKNMVQYLQESKEWRKYADGGCSNIEDLGNAMVDAFLKVDETMRLFQENTNGSDSSGCTSVTAIITPTHIICANAGDSRCVMGTAGVTKELSFDHKPYGDIERKRIESAGGFVQWNRVDGDLAVSRALGDFGYKNSDLLPKDQKISPLPDINVHERTDKDDVLLLACDGLWDVMSSEEAVNLIREIYASGETNPLLIAEEMIDIALDKGSKDNISAVVVKLPGASFGPADGGGVTRRRRVRDAARAAQQAQNGNYYNGSGGDDSGDRVVSDE